MKTDIDIKDDIYPIVKRIQFLYDIGGYVSKTIRPEESSAEDIVISVLANVCNQIQEAYVNINVYVQDLNKGFQYVENTIRLRQLCKVFADELKVVYGDDFRISLDEQRVLPVDGKNEHMINNKVLYKHFNTK